ncbi:TetR family transcriptional regulator [Algimonas arctica]|uniref:TetR family transcriptional regulator n=1 Tax=Algimonas arctica TaxID=1479486 RepID=A0A8J3CPL5_9PROT|nr:TetR/AcrR family transcriptional regulator [Algimonas arctica]GHA91418.1 TetR family transcriptional regulator [Algimonas arctica]
MRREIADIAKQLFQKEGYAKVSMRRIAGEIGCSPMTLYKYYDAKVDVLRTLWADVFRDLFDQLETVPEAHDRQLQGLGLAYVQYWLDHPDFYRLVFISDGVTQSDVSVFIESPELVQRFEIFSQALLDGHEDDLGSNELKAKLDAFICFLNGIAHNMITISGYRWSEPDIMVAMAVRAVTAQAAR